MKRVILVKTSSCNCDKNNFKYIVTLRKNLEYEAKEILVIETKTIVTPSKSRSHEYSWRTINYHRAG